MPTYSYACTNCDNRFDIVQSFTEDSLTLCDDCGGKLRKLFSAVGIVFKGSGFYRTDSRSASVPSSAPSSGAETSAPAPKADKPAASTSATSS